MASFTRNDYYERQLRQLTVERDELAARLAAQDATVWNLQQELIQAKTVQPANLTEVTVALRAYLPTVTQAAGYGALRRATDTKAFAAAIHQLMQDARLVGRREVEEAK